MPRLIAMPQTRLMQICLQLPFLKESYGKDQYDNKRPTTKYALTICSEKMLSIKLVAELPLTDSVGFSFTLRSR